MPLQIMEHDRHEKEELLVSHELANELRELYDLSPINGEDVSINIITNLNGLLKEYVDSEESPVNVIKDSRENIS
jgi:hypothetical protein